MLRPLGDRIIVKAASAEETTAGGIVLPDSAREKPAPAAAPGSAATTGIGRA